MNETEIEQGLTEKMQISNNSVQAAIYSVFIASIVCS